MRLKQFALAAGLLLASVGAAAAAPAFVTGSVNLRSGPGTGYGVINVIPGGATVEVFDCGGTWCRVAWGDRVGFISSAYLDGWGWGPGYVYAPSPYFGFGFGFHRHHHHGHRGHHR